jgi:hypothetical protein
MPDDASQVTAESDQNGRLPAQHEPIGDLGADIGVSALPPSLQVLLNEGLYIRMKQLSVIMSKAIGITPAHLIGKGEACFAVINMALDWRLNPHFVARHTYQTPGGSIGFDGALVQSILERSGRFTGSPEMEYRGNWESLTGKFRTATGRSGGDYVVPTWEAKDATGLGIIVHWQVKGEAKPRVWPGEDKPFWLTQCYPLNSPLWATDPKTQIAYLAIRRFANLAAPGILGAASFDQDDLLDASVMARDVTPPPRPRPEDFADSRSEAETVDRPAPLVIVDWIGDEAATSDDPADAAARFKALLDAAERAKGDLGVAAMWDNNARLIHDLRERGQDAVADELKAYYAERLANAAAAKTEPGAGSGKEPAPASQGAPGAGSGSEQGKPAPNGVAQTPASLTVPLRKAPGNKTDWQGTAQDMVAVIAGLTDLADTGNDGRFKRDNRQGLELMRTGDKNAWSTVEYRLGDRERQLRDEVRDEQRQGPSAAA